MKLLLDLAQLAILRTLSRTHHDFHPWVLLPARHAGQVRMLRRAGLLYIDPWGLSVLTMAGLHLVQASSHR